MNLQAKWIIPTEEVKDAAPVYRKCFTAGNVKKAVLRVTALGVYQACLNDLPVGNFIMAPGFTSYRKRLQVQEYEVTELLNRASSEGEIRLEITVGKGWYHSKFLAVWHVPEWRQKLMDAPMSAIAELSYTDDDGEHFIATDESWEWAESRIRENALYDGEVYDATYEPEFQPAALYDGPTETLIPQEGPEVRAQKMMLPVARITTPKGETVLDFGQNFAGTVHINLNAKAGDIVDFSFGETLDRDGNFYNANYRDAKCLYSYVCKDGAQRFMPVHTFYGFRYLRVNAFPEGADPMQAVTGVVLHSDMKRTGWLESSDPVLNRFFENVTWGQMSNFIDIPTDCPQRDERAGWTADAQVFSRTACLNFDAEQFFKKWLRDLSADQGENGFMPSIIPDTRYRRFASPAWGDAATITPWQVYLAYGDEGILEDQFESMRKWVDYITSYTLVPNLWVDELRPGERHYGDWVALDAPCGSYKGATRDNFIGTAFYAYSTELVVKAGRILKKDISEYEALYERIVRAFRETFTEYTTQTECVLAAHFRLAEDPKKAADQLAEMIQAHGCELITGFVGTPYLLHVLSDYGYAELAYTMLLRREYPSWLYQVTKGATTVWEHLDGIKPDGTMWSKDMNSLNHYAYGCVEDWVYTKACGIQVKEDAPGYQKLRIAPLPNRRLDFLKATLDTRHGRISSGWKWENDAPVYEITTPVETEIVIGGKTSCVQPGTYRLNAEGKEIA